MIEDVFRGIEKHFFSVYKGKHFLWHVAAFALTAILVFTGFDWWFFEHTRSDRFYWIIMIAGVGGFYVPVVVPLAIYLWGDFTRTLRLKVIGAAMGQAVVIAYTVSIFYKAVTGRTQPEFLTHFSTEDITRAFHFGFMENGIFWGWPSSHTSVAWAGAFTLVLLTRARSAQVLAAGYAFFIAFGAAVGFHWFSDVIAGAIIGALVAQIVARNARKQVRT